MRVDSSILQWIDKNGFLNSRSERFEWDYHIFLLEPLSDWGREIAIKKSAQIGFSESFGVMKALYGALFYKWNVIYTLPTDRFAEKFVTTKVDPIVSANGYFGGDVSKGKTVKRVGDRFIFFRGTKNTKPQDEKAESDKGISDTSDLNIHDERDRSDQRMIQQFESRLENSDYGGIWSNSNPTYPGVGTEGINERSDQ